MNFIDLIKNGGLFCDGDWIEKKDQDPNGTVRLIQLADIGVCEFKNKSARFLTRQKCEELKCTYLKKGDILIARLPEPLGRACIFPLEGEYITAVDIAILRIENTEVNNEYLLYLINSSAFRNAIKQYETGTTRKRISRRNLEKINFKLPSLEDQNRIVDQIEEWFCKLDNGVETLNKTKEQLKVYRQAILKKAFEGEFTKLKHEKISIDIEGCSKEEIKNLQEIPSEWKYVHLNKLGDLGRGKSKHRPRNDARLFEDGKYPFLQTSEVKNADKYITEYSKMYGEFGLAQSKLWPKGTLCITIAANIAETAFLGIDACFPDSVVGFTSNENTNPFYIKYFIESQKLRLWAFAPATAQKNINLDTLENLVVPYCSREEQDEVVKEIESRMSVCDDIDRTIDLSLQQAEALRQSILKKAFEGDL